VVNGSHPSRWPAITTEIDRDVTCLPVPTDGTARAASLLAELL
jgi:hypothetical protein